MQIHSEIVLFCLETHNTSALALIGDIYIGTIEHKQTLLHYKLDLLFLVSWGTWHQECEKPCSAITEGLPLDDLSW